MKFFVVLSKILRIRDVTQKETRMSLFNRARRLLHRLRYTPFHPQWFAYSYERLRYEETGRVAYGQVLDVGCGRQPLRKFLAENCDYISLDYPATGGKRYNARPHTFGDAHKLPFPDGSFDTVVLLEVLEHLPDPCGALEEARRVLVHGGRILVSTPFLYPIHDAPMDYRRWTRYGLRVMVRKSGLEILHLRDLGSPVESGVLTVNLSLAWQALNAPMVVRIPLLLCAMVIIPLLNLFGLLVSLFNQDGMHSPFSIGYLMILGKKGGDNSPA